MLVSRLIKRFSKPLSDDYEPSAEEEFMSDRQRAYFKKKLEIWRADIMRGTAETIEHLKTEEKRYPDVTDRARSETERALELRTRDRQRKLVAKIDAALIRLENRTYGYCEKTGDPIDIKRLIARPITTLSIEAQERHEREEKIHRQE